MKRAASGWAGAAALWLMAIVLAPAPALASGRRFDAVVASIQQRFAIRPTRIPMMGFVSFCARVFTRGGVKHMRLAEFDGVGPGLTPQAVDSVLREELGKSWHVFVKEHERDSGDNTFVYDRIGDRGLYLMIADLQNSELSLVQLQLSEKKMVAWVKDPEGSLRSRRDAD